jgi:hypothetical protein
VPCGGLSSSGPVIEALNVPPTSYSRVEIAVVNGWITTCVSSLAEMFSVQPSGDFLLTGGDDSTRPSGPTSVGASGAASGGAAGASAASAAAFTT